MIILPLSLVRFEFKVTKSKLQNQVNINELKVTKLQIPDDRKL